MKTLFVGLLLVLSFPSWSQERANRATIEGTVRNAQGAPLANVNVFLAGTRLGSATSDSGLFTIRNVPVGRYLLVTRAVGYRTIEQEVTLTAAEVVSLTLTLEEEILGLPLIVVTGTRTEKDLSRTPVKTEVVSRDEIQRIGATDLRNILTEQTGLSLINDHGTGIQVQGFDPAYTLILIDGEPLIGRTAGTLELSRVSVGNVQQIEIVKGPSSSLYGSEALAGVINVITQKPTRPMAASSQMKYGTQNTLDLGACAEFSTDRFGAMLFLNRKSSNGYDLTPETISPTVAPYIDYTVSPRLSYTLSDATTLSLNARFYRSVQTSTRSVAQNSQTVLIDDRSTLTDWNIAPALVHRFTPLIKVSGKFYSARYSTNALLSYQSGETYSESTFDQAYHKAESQLDALLGSAHILTAGAGYVLESVRAERITGGTRTSRSIIAYAQEEWTPNPLLDVIVSVRYDGHSDYAARLSPKAALRVTPLPWINVRFSLGSGFKAPTFQQLYLDFTNPSVGYSVFGSTGVKDAIQRLNEEGQIQAILIDPFSLEAIRPEHSASFNGGVEVSLNGVGKASLNVFRNNVRDLIESSPIAIKTNGQSVYTYFNLNRIFTQGIEAEASVEVAHHLSLTLGYQYLEAKDEQVLEQIRAGTISKVGSTGRVRPVQEAEYGGLFNRSRHSGIVKIVYDNPAHGTVVSLRGVVRGKYGFADRNLNGVLDDDSEYAPGYALWNASMAQDIPSLFTLHVGADNLFNKKDPQRLPSVPGRVLFASIRITL